MTDKDRSIAERAREIRLRAAQGQSVSRIAFDMRATVGEVKTALGEKGPPDASSRTPRRKK